MKRFFPLVLIGALAACAGPQTAWLNPGVETARAERTFLACEAQAIADFPSQRQSPINASITIGGRICDGPFCFGALTGPRANRVHERTEALRARAVSLCMEEAGYRKVAVPRCPSEVSPLPLKRHPEELSGICLADGRFALAP